MRNNRHRVSWRLFKYAVFALLALDALLFFREELTAGAGLLTGGASTGELMAVYSATIDTLAWLVLLLLFELETAVLADARLRGSTGTAMTAVRAVCYVLIVTSFMGYLDMWRTVTTVAPESTDPCELADRGYRYVAGLDDYPELTAANCTTLQGSGVGRIEGTQIIGSAAALLHAGRTALVDVVNAGTWLLVVLLLEADVWLQLRGRLDSRLIGMTQRLTIPLYLILFCCAVYWVILGELLDFWDALLWLIAFALIEMNIFDWQAGQKEQ